MQKDEFIVSELKLLIYSSENIGILHVTNSNVMMVLDMPTKRKETERRLQVSGTRARGT